MARPSYLRPEDEGGPAVEAASAGQNGERPQVLAQLAKDISDLIRSARAPLPATPARAVPSPGRRPSTGLQVPDSGARLSALRRAATGVREQAEETSHAIQTAAGAVDEPPSILEAEVRATPSQDPRCSSCGNLHTADAVFCRYCGLKRAEALSPRGSASRARSPHEVHTLLANMESREAGLRLKVQQLTEEKCLREKRLEEEVERLRRSNARMEEELRLRHLGAGAPEAGASSETTEEPVLADVARGSDSGRAWPGHEPAAEDLRFDLQHQLRDIRAEVAHCAQVLQEQPQSLPSAEVLDIRQQLQELSEEVLQTSRALSGGMPGGQAHHRELEEVSNQLERLQRQMSTHSATYARPTEPVAASSSPAVAEALEVSARDIELAELREEVNSLRSQLGQERSPAQAPQGCNELTSKLQEQIEAIRTDLGHLASQASAPAGPRSCNDAGRHGLGELTHSRTVSCHVAALHGRLTAIRAEVARVLHESQNCEDTSSPALQAQLGALLSELSDVRAKAAAVGAAAVGVRGAAAAAELHWAGSQAALRAPCLSAEQAVNSQVEPGVVSPTVNELIRPGNSGDTRFVDMPITAAEWQKLPSRSSCVAPPPVVPGMGQSPLLLCQHLAADLGFSQAAYGINGYGGLDMATQHLAAGYAIPSQQMPSESRPSSARSRGGRSADGQYAASLPFAGSGAGSWLPQEVHRGPSSVCSSRPPEEPQDRPPLGLMRRPSRSKLHGPEVMAGELPQLPSVPGQPDVMMPASFVR
eukprot:TRINITY_DN28899_c0_g1_i1.p1 TRINITY_DN28899_c0_g1~~TRINITY_DN28899_c0_g1_i1.p1  ORF type:complete len:774 (-),score=149.30 TRINITY_DN28899_c0_g1_i1:62-2344(-)